MNGISELKLVIRYLLWKCPSHGLVGLAQVTVRSHGHLVESVQLLLTLWLTIRKLACAKKR